MGGLGIIRAENEREEVILNMEYAAVFKAEIYTELLNDMYATIREFLFYNPNNNYSAELTKEYEELAIAHRKSRFHCDKAHFDQWDQLLSQSRQTLKRAGFSNV